MFITGIQMIQLIQKAVIISLIAILVSGCESVTTREGIGAGIGGILGGLGGNYLAKKAGIDPAIGTAIGVALGATAGMKIGTALDKYFGENDKKNLETVLNEKKAQKVAWCSDKDGQPQQYSTPTRSVNTVQCSGGKKFALSTSKPQPVKTSTGQQQECKVIKTEVSNDSGTEDTVNSTFCRDLPDGKWAEKSA